MPIHECIESGGSGEQPLLFKMCGLIHPHTKHKESKSRDLLQGQLSTFCVFINTYKYVVVAVFACGLFPSQSTIST